MFKVLFALVLIMLFSARTGFSAPAVLVESGKSVEGWKNNPHPISVGKSIVKLYEEQSFESAYQLRTQRRVGVGASGMGLVGAYGALVELNFQPENSVIAGFGGGPQFNSFTFQWKHLLDGVSLTPYYGVAYSRWFSSSSRAGAINKTTPNFLGSRFLSGEEKRSGIFEKNLISPSLGLQYTQLDGPYKGFAVFAEIDLIIEFSELSPVPTAGFGTLYYF